MKKHFLIILFLMLGSSLGFSQTKTIKGQVTAADDGFSLPGVAVTIEGTTVGVATDFDGNYTLKGIPASAKEISFSFIGMKTAVVSIDGKTVIDVVMEADATLVDEVVVTALGISREKKSLGFASTSVGGAEIADSKAVNPMNALQGKVSGIDVSSAPGPGATQNVIIRGASSFGSNQPLYVVDGVPIVNDQNRGGDNLNNNSDFGSGINALNPDDIANMTILKGAAATALYGSRAANGVVLISTKTGKDTGGKLSISYDGSFAVQRVGRIPERQDEFGQGWGGDHALTENGNWGPRYTNADRLFGFVVDNSQMIKPYSFVESRIRDFYDYGINYKNSISASGGNETTNYFLSVSNNNTDGVYPDAVDTYDRTTLSTRGSHSWGAVKISSSVNFSSEKTKAVPGGQGATVFRSILEIAEDYSVIDMKDYNNKFWNMDNYFTQYGINPYYALFENGSEQVKSKLFGKVQADIDFTDKIKGMYRFGGDLENSTSESWTAKYTVPTTAPSYTDSKASAGSYEIYRRRRTEMNHDMYVSYTDELASNFNINALVGLNVNQRDYSRVGGELSALDIPGYYNLSNGTSDAVAEQYEEQRRLVGLFANVELDYDDIYFLTMTARNDWSSTLPLDNNSYFYPGITGSVIVSELLDRSDSKPSFLDFAKARVAYGWTGNDADVYKIDAVYTGGLVSQPGYPNVEDISFPLNGLNSWMVSNRLGNADLAPEITKEIEFGLDVTLFKNRFGFELSYYNKLTEGLINSRPLDPSTGYSSIVANIGDVRNKGFEAVVFGSPVRNDNFEWIVSANYSQNRNKVEKLIGGDEISLGAGFGSTGLYAIEGNEIGVFKTPISEKVTIDGVEYTVVDGNGLAKVTSDAKVLDKTVNEKFRLGLSNTFNYKNFSLGATLDLRYGGYMYSYTKDYQGWTGSGLETTYNDRKTFVIPNSVQIVVDESDESGETFDYVENTTPVSPSTLEDFYTNGGFNKVDDFIIDRSYMKLREAKISYNFSKDIASVLHLKSIRASFVVSNILLWTPAENVYVDPETTSFGNDMSAKFGEYGAGPTNQNYTFGLSLTF